VIKILIVVLVMLYHLTDGYQHYRGTCCFTFVLKIPDDVITQTTTIFKRKGENIHTVIQNVLKSKKLAKEVLTEHTSECLPQSVYDLPLYHKSCWRRNQ
jgi:hypothetical protein